MTAEWTVETLKEHLDALFEEHNHAHTRQHAAAEVVTTAANAAHEKQDALSKEHIETRFVEHERLTAQRFSAQEKAVTAAFSAQEKAISAALAAASTAVSKAETAAEKRFEGVNEFRAQLSDQQRTFIPRQEADAEFRAMRERIEGLTTRLDRSEGRSSGVHASTGMMITIILVAVAVMGLLIKFLPLGT